MELAEDLGGCAQAAYCGAECQKAAWKVHKTTCTAPVTAAAAAASAAPLPKKTCEPPSLPLKDVFDRLRAADLAGDWRGVLNCAGRMEELLGRQPDDGIRDLILAAFIRSHKRGRTKPAVIVGLEARRVKLLHTMQRFPDSIAAMVDLGYSLLLAGDKHQAGDSFLRARDLSAAHAFISLECRGCAGMGQVASMEGRHEDAVEQLRYALAATSLDVTGPCLLRAKK